MKNQIILVVILVCLLEILLAIKCSNKTYYVAPVTPKVAVEVVLKPKKAHIATKKVKVAKYVPQSEKIATVALKYNVSQITMTRVIDCESSHNPSAIGDGGKSFGLVQIHLPSHPNITKAQALDSDFAIDFLAKSLSQGKGKMWTCFRNLNKV
jgi:hypothetical protein